MKNFLFHPFFWICMYSLHRLQAKFKTLHLEHVQSYDTQATRVTKPLKMIR